MNEYIEVMAIVEGRTEQTFIEQLLAPYLSLKNIFITATHETVNAVYARQQSEVRFIPYMAIHEFEALLFSNTAIVAEALNVDENEITSILHECGEPEAINNSPSTAPSKRLDTLSPHKKFPKTTVGIMIARKIGIQEIREKCPLFNSWLQHLENLAGVQA